MLVVLIISLVSILLISLGPLKRLFPKDKITSTAFSAVVSTTRELKIGYAGRLHKGSPNLETIPASGLEIIFIMQDGGTKKINGFQGEIKPYDIIEVDVPEGAEEYIIYYNKQRIRGGQILG